jgi:membrane protein YdbS with pleckstrin-like domain
VANVARYLLRTERQIFAVRRHGASLAWAAGLLGLYWLGGLLALWLFVGVELLRLTALSFLGLSALWFVWVLIDWHYERFIVTNQRVLLVSGVLTRRVAIMPLIKVTDLTFEQTLPGRILHYGTFIIESAGQEQALSRVDYLPQPNLHYLQVSELLFGPKPKVDPEDVEVTGSTQPVPHLRRDADR